MHFNYNTKQHYTKNLAVQKDGGNASCRYKQTDKSKISKK